MDLTRRALGLLSALALACGSGSASRPAVAEPRPTAPVVKRASAVIDGKSAERVKLAWEAASGGYARAVAVSRTLGRVAFASRTHVALYELDSGKPLGRSEPCAEVVHTGLGFVRGRLHVVCDDRVVSFATKQLTAIEAPKVHESRSTAAVFRGHFLALGHRDGVIRVYDLHSGARREIVVPGPPIDVKSLALTSDGRRVAVAWVQGSVWWWDVTAPDQPHQLVRHDSESDALAFSQGGARLAEEGARNTTTLWELSEPPKVVAQLKNGDWIKQLEFTRDDQWLARGGSDGLELAEVGGPRRVVLEAQGRVEDLALDESGSVLVAGDRDGRLTVWMTR